MLVAGDIRFSPPARVGWTDAGSPTEVKVGCWGELANSNLHGLTPEVGCWMLDVGVSWRTPTNLHGRAYAPYTSCWCQSNRRANWEQTRNQPPQELLIRGDSLIKDIPQ